MMAVAGHVEHGALYLFAKSIVDAHEANIERGRKQAEERQRAIDETARRWPGLAAKGWRYECSGLWHGMKHDTKRAVDLDSASDCLMIDGFGDGGHTDTPVALALIDAAGKNTTADRLRKAMREAVTVAITGGFPASAVRVLREALDA
jgi:hypothetical protein